MQTLTCGLAVCQGMTENGIDQLRADLAALDADCAEQIRKTVHDNYHQFIQACQVPNGSTACLQCRLHATSANQLPVRLACMLNIVSTCMMFAAFAADAYQLSIHVTALCQTDTVCLMCQAQSLKCMLLYKALLCVKRDVTIQGTCTCRALPGLRVRCKQ